jgi:hypothetical protein
MPKIQVDKTLISKHLYVKKYLKNYLKVQFRTRIIFKNDFMNKTKI